MNHQIEKVKLLILEHSQADNTADAYFEWDYYFYYFIPEHLPLDNCQCGVKIREVNFIKNRLNDNILKIGNICIRLFIDNQKLILEFEKQKKLSEKEQILKENPYKFCLLCNKKRRANEKNLQNNIPFCNDCCVDNYLKCNSCDKFKIKLENSSHKLCNYCYYLKMNKLN
jgi:hypothetical protein